jgi:Fur family transcriptional regulator, stress-responsive regulator
VTVPSPVDTLVSHGLRVTAPRCGVLASLAERPHSSVADIAEQLRPQVSLSRQGLYNVLHDLTAARLLRCITPAGMNPRYELRRDDDHHHMICRSCGHIEDAQVGADSAPCVVPPAIDGFTVDQTDVVWWGLCRVCLDRNDPAGAAPTTTTLHSS